MQYSHANCVKIIESNICEWSRRSRSDLILSKGKGCFVWDSETDGSCNASGMFYTYDMIPSHFKEETASNLQKMIQEANNEKEIVVALFFENSAIGFILKMDYKPELKDCPERNLT